MTQQDFQRRFVGCLGPGGFHKMVYAEWGPADDECPVLCVHGLTRNGRDFDALAARLAAAGRRVVCPDIVGRGQSDWLGEDAGAAYGYPQYMTDLTTLIARLDVRAVDWVGASMGGLIGMFMAAAPGAPVRSLLLNDIGPFIPAAGLEHLAGHVGLAPAFADLDALEAYLRHVSRGFGPLTDAQWRHLATHGARRLDDGRVTLRYDPRIGDALRAGPIEDVDLWDTWAHVALPTLVVRGADSEILDAETAARMATRDGVELVEFAGVGHAPMLMADDQIAAVMDWLARQGAP